MTVCTAELFINGQDPYPCTRPAGHAGRHVDRDGDNWEIRRGTCGAMRSPNPDERYDCSRVQGHEGAHLDDAQNVMWINAWGPSPGSLTQHLPEPSEGAGPDGARWQELMDRAGGNRDQLVLSLFDGLGEADKRITDLQRAVDRVNTAVHGQAAWMKGTAPPPPVSRPWRPADPPKSGPTMR